MESSRTEVPKKLQSQNDNRCGQQNDCNTSGQFAINFVLEQTCNFYEYFSDFMIVYNK